jgi:hypothetical protein
MNALDLGPRKHGDVPGECAIVTCASLLALGMFMDTQILVGDDAYLDLAMLEARRLFKMHLRDFRVWWQPLDSTRAANSRDGYIFSIV